MRKSGSVISALRSMLFNLIGKLAPKPVGQDLNLHENPNLRNGPTPLPSYQPSSVVSPHGTITLTFAYSL